jgi:cytochrome bd ubiquinol oxidase subunit I
MQHPVGYTINHVTHRAQLTSIFAVLTNSTLLLAFPHTIFAALCTGGFLVLGISAYGLLRARSGTPHTTNVAAGGDGASAPLVEVQSSGHDNLDVYRRSVRLVLPLALAAAVLTGAFGHTQGMLMEEQQPMKMAAAEALYKTTSGASLSIFAVGPFEHFPKRLNTDIRIPHLLSIIGTFSWNGTIKGVDQLNAEDQRKYGPGDYVPILGVTYWTFRLMAGVGLLLLVIPLLGMLLARRKRLERSRRFLWVCVGGAFLPVLANLTGWIFTEMGRQPWVVYGLLKTSEARSPLVGSGSIVLSLCAYTLVYGTLLLVGGKLFLQEIAHGPEAEPSDEPRAPGAPPTQPELVLAY